MSRDPLRCSELVLSLQARLEPEDEVEIVMDRRRPPEAFKTRSGAGERPAGDRRHNVDADLEVRTKGFAIVPGAATPRAAEEPDADDRARFENILSFRRRRAPRPVRAVGAASAVMVALVLAPPLNLLPDIAGDTPPTVVTTRDPSGQAPPRGPGEPSGGAPAPAIGEKTSSAAATGVSSRPPSSGSEVRASGTRAARAPRPSSAQSAIEEYAARVQAVTGRVVEKAKGLIERVKSEVIAKTMSGATGPSGDKPVVPLKRHRAATP